MLIKYVLIKKKMCSGMGNMQAGGEIGGKNYGSGGTTESQRKDGGDGGAKRMEQNGSLSQMEKALKQREIEMKELKERLVKDPRKPGKRAAHG